MAILIRCKECKTEMKTDAKQCQKCGTQVPKKGKTYKVVVRSQGKKKTRTTTNFTLAKEIEAKLKIDIARGEFDVQKKKTAPTLNEFWAEQFLPWLQKNKNSWKIDYYNFTKHLSPALGNKSLDLIAPFDVEKFVLSLKKKRNKQNKTLSAATIKHQLVLLTRIFSIAEQWGVFTGRNPCQRVRKPKLNNEITEYLQDDELSRLLTVLESWPDRMQASIVLFCLYTGLRRGEIFSLTWNDVDLVRKKMTIRDPKGKLDQNLPLSDKAIDVLKAVPRKYETEYIFYSVSGEKRKTIRHGWNLIKEAAQLPADFRFHGLRHHFASSLVSAGVDIYTVQKLLCHKDSKTTQRYAHLADKTLKDAVNLGDKLNTIK